MITDPARQSLLTSLVWQGLGAFAVTAGVFSAGELFTFYWDLNWSSRIALAGIVAFDISAYVVVRVERRRKARQASAPRRYTTIHPAPEGEHWAAGSWDANVGNTIPVRGLGPDEVTGRIVAATVAADGRSVELTLEVPAIVGKVRS